MNVAPSILNKCCLFSLEFCLLFIFSSSYTVFKCSNISRPYHLNNFSELTMFNYGKCYIAPRTSSSDFVLRHCWWCAVGGCWFGLAIRVSSDHTARRWWTGADRRCLLWPHVNGGAKFRFRWSSGMPRAVCIALIIIWFHIANPKLVGGWRAPPRAKYMYVLGIGWVF